MLHLTPDTSPRLLKMLAEMVAKEEVTIALSERIRHPLIVVYESRTLVIHPQRADFFDICLGAALLSFRKEARESVEGESAQSLREYRTAWVQTALKSLKREFPGIHRLPGKFKQAIKSTWPSLVWNKVPFRKLERDESPGDGVSCEFMDGIETQGRSSDWGWILNKVCSDNFPIERWKELPELPIATIPLKFTVSSRPGPKFEEYERRLKDEEIQQIVQNLKQCYQRSAEAALTMKFQGSHLTTGLRLDSNRLVSALGAQRAGVSPRIFLKRRDDLQPIFKPEEHLVVVAFDANAWQKSADDDERQFSWRTLLVFLEIYRQLEVDLEVIGFSDHLLDLGDARKTYVHLPAVLKRVEDPMDGAFYNRLASLIENPPRIPHSKAVAFHPLIIRSILQRFREASAGNSHRYHTLLMATRRGMRADVRFQTPDRLTRTARTMDRQIADKHAEFEGSFIHTGCFIPDELKDHAAQGGAVSRMY